MDYVVLTPAELILAKEAVAPTLCKTTDLLLRGGALGYLDLERHIQKECGMHSSASSKGRRINPVTFKQIITRCGVMLTPSELKGLRRAYSDEGGFLVDTFLELVRPLSCLSESQAAVLHAMCAGVLDGSGETTTVLLDDLLQMLERVFAGDESAASAFAGPLLEAHMVFSPARYPKSRVPPYDVMNFFAAIFLNYADFGELLLGRLEGIRLYSAPMERSLHESSMVPSKLDASVRRDRLFEYYTDRDNRDEWIRGREENEARSMYLRHLPGYQGHMPTFRSKFGRTFHAIEESMPVLSQPKPEREPVPADRYGPGVELRDNRMSRHHFRFS